METARERSIGAGDPKDEVPGHLDGVPPDGTVRKGAVNEEAADEGLTAPDEETVADATADVDSGVRPLTALVSRGVAGSPHPARSGVEGGDRRGRPAQVGSRGKGGERRNQADLLLALMADAKPFTAPGGVAYAEVVEGERQHFLPLRGSAAEEFLKHRFWKAYRGSVGPQACATALETLSASARFEGPRREVFHRVGSAGGSVYFDLCDDRGRVVEVSARGWKVLGQSPVPFLRPASMGALPVPVKGGRIEDLRPLINARDDTHWVRICGWLVSTLRPGTPQFLLLVRGGHGTAKSTLTRMLKRLVDPSTEETPGLPQGEEKLLNAAWRGWVTSFDNVGTLSSALSDGFCRIATGTSQSRAAGADGGQSRRLCRPALLNGIGPVAERADLLSRALMIDLPAIPPDRREDEAELLERFETLRPQLLGALLTLASAALKHDPQTHLPANTRMVGPCRWVSAAESRLGWRPHTFLTAAFGMTVAAGALAGGAMTGGTGAGAGSAGAGSASGGGGAGGATPVQTPDPLFCAILSLMARQARWQGTPTALLQALAQEAPADVAGDADWPRSPNAMSRRIEHLAGALAGAGIDIRRGKSGDQRRWSLVRRAVGTTGRVGR